MTPSNWAVYGWRQLQPLVELAVECHTSKAQLQLAELPHWGIAWRNHPILGKAGYREPF